MALLDSGPSSKGSFGGAGMPIAQANYNGSLGSAAGLPTGGPSGWIPNTGANYNGDPNQAMVYHGQMPANAALGAAAHEGGASYNNQQSPYPMDYGQQLGQQINQNMGYNNADQNPPPPVSLGPYQGPYGNYQGQVNQAAANAVFGYNAPNIVGLGNNANAIQNQMQLNQANYGLQSGNLQDTYNLQVAGLGLQRQGIGMDQGYLNSLIPLHQSNMDINNQQAANYGLMNQNIQQQQGNIGAQSGNLDQQLQNTIAHLQTGAATQTRGVNSQFTAGGNWFTPEHGAQNKDIQTNLQQGVLGATLGTAYQQLGLQNSVLNLSNESLGNMNNILSQKQANNSEQMSINDINNKLAHTGLDLQQLGLDRQGLDQKLNYGLGQLGLSTAMDASKLYQMLNSNNMQVSQLGQQMIQELLGMGYSTGGQ